MLQKPPSRAAEKAEKKRETEREKRRVYKSVNIRDRYTCRACGTQPRQWQMPLHHHEIRFRSAGGTFTTANVCLLCAKDHADIHAHRLTVTGDANGVLTFERDGKVWTS